MNDGSVLIGPERRIGKHRVFVIIVEKSCSHTGFVHRFYAMIWMEIGSYIFNLFL
jgi:hypothetical protein